MQSTKPAVQSVTVLASAAGLLVSVAAFLDYVNQSGIVPPKYALALTGVASAIALIRRWTDRNPTPIEGIVNQK